MILVTKMKTKKMREKVKMPEAVVQKMFLNVIQFEAKVKDSPTLQKVKLSVKKQTRKYKKAIKKNKTLIRK